MDSCFLGVFFPPSTVMAYCPLQIKWKISPALKQQPLHHAAQLDSVSIPSQLNRTGIVTQVPRCPLMGDVGFIYWRRHLHALGKSYLLALNHPCRNKHRKSANISRGDLGLNRARRTGEPQEQGEIGLRARGEESNVFWDGGACRAPLGTSETGTGRKHWECRGILNFSHSQHPAQGVSCKGDVVVSVCCAEAAAHIYLILGKY